MNHSDSQQPAARRPDVPAKPEKALEVAREPHGASLRPARRLAPSQGPFAVMARLRHALATIKPLTAKQRTELDGDEGPETCGGRDVGEDRDV